MALAAPPADHETHEPHETPKWFRGFLRFVVPSGPKPRFFAKPERFGAWLARYGGKRSELVVGYWKVGSGKASMTWPQSVEQALMHGWIDGVRRSLGDEAYCIRFTPRRKGSNWSNVNLRLARRLLDEGRMAPAGRLAYERRKKGQTPRAAHEQPTPPKLGAAEAKRFRQERAAWAWFKATPPSYQRTCTWWVQSAKKPETRSKRLDMLIRHCRAGEVLPGYRWGKKWKAATPTPRRQQSRSVNSN